MMEVMLTVMDVAPHAKLSQVLSVLGLFVLVLVGMVWLSPQEKLVMMGILSMEMGVMLTAKHSQDGIVLLLLLVLNVPVFVGMELWMLESSVMMQMLLLMMDVLTVFWIMDGVVQVFRPTVCRILPKGFVGMECMTLERSVRMVMLLTLMVALFSVPN